MSGSHRILSDEIDRLRDRLRSEELTLREQIAKEIESTWFYDFQCKYSNCKSFQQAAAIARGEVKDNATI